MARSVTIYREGKNGAVEKEEVGPGAVTRIEYPENYRERIIANYAELEREGKLNDMGPRTKQQIRDLHTHAQCEGYWRS